MGEDSDSEGKPKKQTSGSRQPPRNPPPVALSAPADDPDENPKNSKHHQKKNRKKETVRISLPPKPSKKDVVHLTLPPKPAAGSGLQLPSPPMPQADSNTGHQDDCSMTVEEAVEYVLERGLHEEPESPARKQLHKQAEALAHWAGLTFIASLLPLASIGEFGSVAPIIVTSLLVVKAVLFSLEADRMRKVVRCFDQRRARTLDELKQHRAANV